MAGYADDFSMSNNAIDAYDRGLRPRSKWSKADILNALPANARAYLQLDGYPLEFLREYFLVAEEWHHTSKLYNKTEFYRPGIDQWEDTYTPEDVQDLYLVPSTRSFANPGYTRRAAYVNTPTAPTSTSMRPTSAPPKARPRSSRRSNAA